MADDTKDGAATPAKDNATSWLWRYKTPPVIDPKSYYSDDGELGTAWLRLQLIHTSFRLIDAKDYRELSARLESIERLFLERPSLQGYYDECFAPEQQVPLPGPSVLPLTSPETRHVAAIQIQFLEDMFYSLDLDRYGNAPDNRGWMNLFRRWGRSPRFNRYLDDLRSTLTLGFLEFYDFYLRYHQCRVDERPIPHPWDAEERRWDYRTDDTKPPPPTGGDPGPCLTAPSPVEGGPLFPGLFLDSGIREVEDRDPRDPDARSGPGTGAPGGGEHAQPDTKAGEPGAAPPGPSSASGSPTPGSGPTAPG